QAVAIGLADIVEFNDLIAQALCDRDEDFLGFVALLVLVRSQLLETRQTRLGFGLAALGILAHPFQLFLDGALAGGFGSLFLLEAVFLLLQPGTVVALPWNAMAAVQLQYPFRGIVQKITVVGHPDHRAR